MITKADICTFLHNENEQQRKDMKEYYALPVDDRIQKRKCIAHLFYDESFKESSREYGTLFRFTFEKNTSDLKPGDYVLLTKDNPSAYLHVSKASLPIVDLGSDYVIVADRVSSLGCIANTEYTLDACFFNSRDINASFMVANNERKEKWLKVINEVPRLEFNDFPDLDKVVADICKGLEIELTPSQKRAIYEAVANKEYSLIQGPPGTGKTFVIAIIAYILLICGNKVLISSSNHLAINNVLCKIHKFMAKVCDVDPLESKKEPTEDDPHPTNTLDMVVFKVGHAYQASGLDYEFKGEKISVMNLPSPNTSYFMGEDKDSIKRWIIGVTPQTFYTRARGLEADVLILDEAGQLTIPTALMAMQKADYVVLVGDHKQLPPICAYKNHPEKLKQSIFQAMYRDYNCVTLDKSYRMNGQICRLISDTFYDGQLEPVYKDRCLENRNDESPLMSAQSVLFKDIEHKGTCVSDEEADCIVSMIETYVNEYHVSVDNIAVMAPFRVQCAHIRRKLCKVLDKIPAVDTIDRMQGQERDIIFLSFTAGDLAYATELAEFLYNTNKINVAVSRARCKLIMVGNKSCIKSAISKSEKPDVFAPIVRLLENDTIQTL